jgi:hypothetical protein
MNRRYQTTADVEAYYRTHPADHKGPKMALWLRIVLIAAGAVMVLGFILALGA